MANVSASPSPRTDSLIATHLIIFPAIPPHAISFSSRVTVINTSTVVSRKMEDSHMKEMSILILMLKISLETKMEICMHLEMADHLFDGVQKRMKCCLITA